MDSQPSPPAVRSFLPAALILMLLGWGGIAVIDGTPNPTALGRAGPFFSPGAGLTGTALPIMAYLNRRFPSKPPPSTPGDRAPGDLGRHLLPHPALAAIGRVVTLPLALLLAAGLILIELLLRLRERSQWKPETHA